jgi:Predicted membrane protein
MSFKRINNITGWAIFLIASIVYLMTMEATGSFWDCGEFVSSCYKLQIPHPPGAPLFVLMGRIFTIPFDAHHAAIGVNTMSALASGFTILFLFWSITHFARKIFQQDGGTLNNNRILSIMAAGVVGSLAYCFSDSFWYSAVEGEVYALSSFFTAIVFWAILKWEQEVTDEQKEGIKGNFTRADRWLILIFYLIGLAVGVHLLNLLTIPAIVMVYYFKRYRVTKMRTFFAFIIGCVITGIVQLPVIQWTIKLAGQFDIWFKNDLGLPFFVGFGFFFVLMAVLIFFAIRVATKRNWNFLKLAMWSFAFILLGFSTYYTTLIRSNSDPAVDMFNVDNPVSLVGYLSREQYGDWPILFGQDFTAEPTEQKAVDTYVKGKNRYEKIGRRYDIEYAPEDKHFFPRMWDASNDQHHADYYAAFAGIQKDEKTGKYLDKPTMGDNISFFVKYQTNWMYWRYFMWNFAGKQDDVQGVDIGNVRDGNWSTGIGFWDNIRLGDQSKLPDSLKHNKAHNNLYCLPLILGILGFIYQYKKDKRDTLVNVLLFFFTGFAVVIYLNQAGNQPRERDYAYVGSFYVFAIWIGIGFLYVRELINKYVKDPVGTYVAAAVCTLAVPVLMAAQEWDDHDRSKKVLARDMAIDYLESCAPNAIVISFGDNDTYPLWYAQEVEGVRRDVRVINSSLLGTDWYINQLRYKVNKSDPIDVIWTPDQIIGSKRDGIYFYADAPGAKVDQTQPMELYTLMKDYAGSEDPNRMVQISESDFANIYPTKKVKISVDKDFVKQNGTVNASDSVVNEVTFDIPRNVLGKNESAILNIIAANKWKRPIYFTSPYDELGFQQYLRTDGLTYRLVPVKNSTINRDWAFDKLMNKFVFGNADKHGVYYDEENRRHLNSIRMQFASVAINLADNNRKEDAKKLVERCDKMMLQENFPYGMVSRSQQHNQISGQFLLAAYKAGDSVLAQKVAASLRKDLEQQVSYYNSLDEDKQGALSYENQLVMNMLKEIQQMEQYFKTASQLNPETSPVITNSPKLKDTQVHDKMK